MLPAGFHFFVFSAAPASAAADPSSAQGVAARHGLLRFFEPGERLVQEWDNMHEELKRTAPPKKRRRTARASSGSEAEATLVSDDYLKRLDASLAPYPSDALAEQWRALAGFVTEETVARVVGLDEQRCGVVDALTSSAADEAGMAAGAGATSSQRTWGKARGAAAAGEGDVDAADPQPDVREVVELDKEDGEEGGPELLEFVRFDERRSWPRGAVGEELTHWSKDKSWQLSEVVRSQLNNGAPDALSPPYTRLTCICATRPEGAARRVPARLRALFARAQLFVPLDVQVALLPHLPVRHARLPAIVPPNRDNTPLTTAVDHVAPALCIVPLGLSRPGQLSRRDVLLGAAPLA